MPDTLYFGAAFGGFVYPEEDIVCEFEVLEDRVAAYNTENFTNYDVLPSNSYKLDGLTATIKKGELSSNTLKIAVDTESEAIEIEKEYMLPIRLQSISGSYPVNEERRIAYFVVRATYESLDKGMWEVVEFDSQEAVAEGSDNGRAIFAIDGNENTYWHTQYDGVMPEHPHHIVIDLGGSHGVHSLNIYGQAGWAPGRPELVEVLFSEDQVEWESSGDFEISGQAVMNTINFIDNGKRTLTGRYMKLVVKRSFENTPYMAIAEIEAY